MAGRGLGGAGVLQQFKSMVGLFASAEAGRAEEDYCVLDLLAAEAGQGLKILGDDADDAAVGAVEECGVLVGKGSFLERLRGRRVRLIC